MRGSTVVPQASPAGLVVNSLLPIPLSTSGNIARSAIFS